MTMIMEMMIMIPPREREREAKMLQWVLTLYRNMDILVLFQPSEVNLRI
jgi:hypothetical protein